MSSKIKTLLTTAIMMTVVFCAHAQSSFNLDAETRLGLTQDGFRGDYLNLKASGSIAENVGFNYRQRFNRLPEPGGYFNSVDFLYINWNVDKWTFSTGKQVVLIGGYEYDRAPIDLYVCSEYWQNIACYQLGVSASYKFSDTDALTFQVCQSPYHGMSDNLYACNLYYSGTVGNWSTLSSFNLIEVERGKFLKYVALGESLQLGTFRIEFDLMDRFSSLEELTRNCSVMTELSWRASHALKTFLKGSVDYNDFEESRDFCVLPGTSLLTAGAGVEYYPLKDSEDIRIFGIVGHVRGENGNPAGTLTDGLTFGELGLKIKLKLK